MESTIEGRGADGAVASMGRQVALCLAVAILTMACGKDTYRPVYYPNKSNLTVYSRGPAFDNLAQARQWIEEQHATRRDQDWDYEIGKNCRPFQDTEIEVCKDTLR